VKLNPGGGHHAILPKWDGIAAEPNQAGHGSMVRRTG
jgi:hypothetical protein